MPLGLQESLKPPMEYSITQDMVSHVANMFVPVAVFYGYRVGGVAYAAKLFHARWFMVR